MKCLFADHVEVIHVVFLYKLWNLVYRVSKKLKKLLSLTNQIPKV